MSKEDLIPFNTRPKGEHRLISQKGGQSVGQTKSEGQKLRQIKARLRRAEMTDEDSKWLLEKIENRPAMAAELLITLDGIKKDIANMHPMAKITLANTEVNAAKFIHGEKIKTENVNYNVDVNDAVRQAFLLRKQKKQEND